MKSKWTVSLMVLLMVLISSQAVLAKNTNGQISAIGQGEINLILTEGLYAEQGGKYELALGYYLVALNLKKERERSFSDYYRAARMAYALGYRDAVYGSTYKAIEVKGATVHDRACARYLRGLTYELDANYKSALFNYEISLSLHLQDRDNEEVVAQVRKKIQEIQGKTPY